MIRRFTSSSSAMSRAIQLKSIRQRHCNLLDDGFSSSWGNRTVSLYQGIYSRHVNFRIPLQCVSSHTTLVTTNDILDKGMPFKRSRVSAKKTPLLDPRAEAKLAALSLAKENVNITQAKYMTRMKNTSADDDYLLQLEAKLKESQKELAVAYSQAIKYCSRIMNNSEATITSEELLYEWINNFLNGYSQCEEGGIESKIEKNATMNKKSTIKSIHNVVRTVKANFRSEHDDSLIRISPPMEKDYINMLRAYSVSKARKKGEQAEALLVNMIELTNAMTRSKNPNVQWIKESIPNSKMFALAIKCYAGSTHKDSLDKVQLLNYMNDEFARACGDIISGLFMNDPYVMLHSIKLLRNFHIEGEKQNAEEWLGKLHGFVIDSENEDYFFEENTLAEPTNEDNVNDTDNENCIHKDNNSKIDVTSAYMAVIRLFARMRGEKGAAAEAQSVLDRMHQVHSVMMGGPEDKCDGTSNSIAVIDIRVNAYNLLLGMYRDSKIAEDATHAIELLSQMIDAGNKKEQDRNGVPLPTNQSFEYTILSMTKMTDSDAAVKEAERFIALLEETEYLDISISVYNALLTLCTKTLYGKRELYTKAMEILEKLNKASKTFPGLAPNPETMSLLLKACAHSKCEDPEIVLDTATKIFSGLVAQEENEKSALALKDSSYFHMMLCVMNHDTGDDKTKKEQIEELFSQACQRGLCSSAVLTLFRNNTSEEEYRLTVGKGRLADNWLANVTSPKSLYTDGSSKGAGKNARRHGKSTSNWAKKQRQKVVQLTVKKASMRAKKIFKKL